MPQGARTERVSEEFREILAEAIQALKDPRVGFVTVTGVKVSPDLRVAWVYYTVLGVLVVQNRTRRQYDDGGLYCFMTWRPDGAV